MGKNKSFNNVTTEKYTLSLGFMQDTLICHVLYKITYNTKRDSKESASSKFIVF